MNVDFGVDVSCAGGPGGTFEVESLVAADGEMGEMIVHCNGCDIAYVTIEN
jgi:hypothetical protein